jgi:HTH-type transcriptional regulator/antitoxin HigA
MNKTFLSMKYSYKGTNESIDIPVCALRTANNEHEYNRTEKILNNLIDIVKEDERHPLQELMQIIGDSIESYDDLYNKPMQSGISDIDMVKHLMDQNGLCQKDLVDVFGVQGNVSKFLSGKRNLSKNNIERLKEKFNISADFFIRGDKKNRRAA